MKRFITFCMAAVMTLSLTVNAFAAKPNEAEKKEKPEKTGTAIEEIQSKFDSLSDKEKNEIYDLSGNITEQKIKLIEKYAELDLIDKDEAKEMIENMRSMSDKAKSDGLVPGGILPPGHNATPKKKG